MIFQPILFNWLAKIPATFSPSLEIPVAAPISSSIQRIRLAKEATMSVLRYDPWRLFHQVQRDMSNLFDARSFQRADAASAPRWVPAVDIEDHHDRFVIRADIPGVDPKNIEIQTEDGVLTIRGTREEAQPAEAKFIARETARGGFVRRFTLPDRVDTDAIKARSANGVLEVTIPKASAIQPRQIKVEH
jgi:HSP20 family protein